jgi:hypothetical protein
MPKPFHIQYAMPTPESCMELVTSKYNNPFKVWVTGGEYYVVRNYQDSGCIVSGPHNSHEAALSASLDLYRHWLRVHIAADPTWLDEARTAEFIGSRDVIGAECARDTFIQVMNDLQKR